MEPIKPIKKIAKDKKVPVKAVKSQVKMGKKIEKEHTPSVKKAEKIAKQHLNERPDYYTMLRKAEKTPVRISGREDWNKNGRKG